MIENGEQMEQVGLKRKSEQQGSISKILQSFYVNGALDEPIPVTELVWDTMISNKK